MRPRRLVSLLVAGCMVVSMVPASAVTAFADAGAGTSVTEQVDSTAYQKLAKAIADAKAGDTITLSEDVDVQQTLVVDKQLTLDLAGHKLYNTNDLWDKPTAQDNNWSLISVRGNGDLTITGNGVLDAKENDCYAVDLQDEATKLTIENGEFIGNITAIYAHTGEAVINGGKFWIRQLNNNNVQDGYGLTLNCLDANRKNGTAKIHVTGGTYYKFDPANNCAEGANTNFCAVGYITTQDGDWYTAREYQHSTLTTNIGEQVFEVNKPTEFTFTTTANDDAGINVVGVSDFSDDEAIEKLEYYEPKTGTWYDLNGAFGGTDGFPMADATSKFRATFNKAGTYYFTASMKKADGGEELCNTNGKFTVKPSAYNVDTNVKPEEKPDTTVNGEVDEPVKIDVAVTGTEEQLDCIDSLSLNFSDPKAVADVKLVLGGDTFSLNDYADRNYQNIVLDDLFDQLSEEPALLSLESEPETTTGEMTLYVSYRTKGKYTVGVVFKDPYDAVVSEQTANVQIGEMKSKLTFTDCTATVDGKEIASGDEVAEGKTVTLKLAADVDQMKFGGFVLDPQQDSLKKVDDTTATFTMPDAPVTVTVQLNAEDSDGGVDALTVVAGVAVGAGTAVLAYHIGTEVYAERVLGKGVAVPKTRADVALKAWELAGKPAVAVGEPLSEAAQAEKWAVESGLMQNDAQGSFNGQKKMNKLAALRTLDAAKKLG